MSFKEKLIWWIIGIALILVFISSISNILLPFVIAAIVAYFLDPIVDKLENSGLSRTMATALITVLFFLVCVGVAIIISPILYDQFIMLLHKVPSYIVSIQENVIPKFSSLVESIDGDAVKKLNEAAGNMSGKLLEVSASLMKNVLNSGLALVNLISILFITPVVTFYLLRDWDIMIERLDRMIPPRYVKTVEEQMRLIDQTLAGYIRGQTNVCVLLGLFYSIALMIVGLDFGFVIGFSTGLLSFIPYVGMIMGMSIALIVAFFQYGGLDGISSIAIILSIFIVGQVIEGSFVSPKLVGDKVGLHPAWIIFGMLAGASLFGFTGILLAVPVTAVIGVLIRFCIAKYRDSDLYLGASAGQVSDKTSTNN